MSGGNNAMRNRRFSRKLLMASCLSGILCVLPVMSYAPSSYAQSLNMPQSPVQSKGAQSLGQPQVSQGKNIGDTDSGDISLKVIGKAGETDMDNSDNPWLSLGNVIGDNSRIGSSGISRNVSEINLGGHRDFKVAFYFPKNILGMKAPVPVIVVSTRWKQPFDEYTNIFQRIASHGYVVAVPEHLDALPNSSDTNELLINASDLQSRVDDIHDTIRSIPLLRLKTGLNLSDNYACLGFQEGSLSCLLNSGISDFDMTQIHKTGVVNGWSGDMQSMLLVSPPEGYIPVSRKNGQGFQYGDVSTPVMIVSTMDGLNIQNGAVALMPSNGIRAMAAFKTFNEPLVTASQQEDASSFKWESLIVTWFNATLKDDMKNMDALKGQYFDRYTDGDIRTVVNVGK